MAWTVIGYMWSRMANVASQQIASRREGNKPAAGNKQPLVSVRFLLSKQLLPPDNSTVRC